MKIFIEYDLKNESGKGKFIQRLTKQWDKMGVEYSDTESGCDVRFAITRYRTKSKLPTVIRIDGAHAEFNVDSIKNKSERKKTLKNLAWKNSITASDISRSEAVIWQSEFCRMMGKHIFKKNAKREYVIFNGDNPDDYKRNPQNDGFKRVIMSARWKHRKHKRLKEMLQIANMYLKKNDKVMFYIAGDNDVKYEKHNNIVMLGHLGMETLKDLLCKCDCMLNIAYFDWCPNAVVEALVAGLPVICSNQGGVPEIVKDSGVILQLDNEIPTNLERATNPPEIKLEPVVDAFDEVLYGNKKFSKAEHLYIEFIARQYTDVFKDVLGERNAISL